jgi:hypothetical protein
MDQVIETFRSHFGEDLMVNDQFIQPFGLISRVFKLLVSDPLDAVGWFSEIASACAQLKDPLEELFVLSIAAEAARAADRRDVSPPVSRIL